MIVVLSWCGNRNTTDSINSTIKLSRAVLWGIWCEKDRINDTSKCRRFINERHSPCASASISGIFIYTVYLYSNMTDAIDFLLQHTQQYDSLTHNLLTIWLTDLLLKHCDSVFADVVDCHRWPIGWTFAISQTSQFAVWIWCADRPISANRPNLRICLQFRNFTSRFGCAHCSFHYHGIYVPFGAKVKSFCLKYQFATYNLVIYDY